MFGRSKKPVPSTPNKLWEIFLHIGRGTNTEMPPILVGAYVGVYVAREDHETALRGAVAEIRKRGYVFIDLKDGKVNQLDPHRWDAHVMSHWPEHHEHFPSQEDVVLGLNSGRIFFGPFAGYEAPRAQQGGPDGSYALVDTLN